MEQQITFFEQGLIAAGGRYDGISDSRRGNLSVVLRMLSHEDGRAEKKRN